MLLGKLLIHGISQEGYYIWALMRRDGKTFSIRRTDDFLILNIWRTPEAADFSAEIDLTLPDIIEHIYFVGFFGNIVREYLDFYQEFFVNSLVMKLVEIAQRIVIGIPKQGLQDEEKVEIEKIEIEDIVFLVSLSRFARIRLIIEQ